MKKVKIGVIGTGYLGKFHAQKYASMDDIDLVGVVDIDKDTAQKIASDLGTKAYFNYQDLLGHVDAVSIVAPTPLHFSIAKEFLSNNIDIMLEKPITTNTVEAEKLIEIAKEKDCIIQVGHLERYNPAIVFIKDKIDKPRFIEANRLSIYKERGTDVSVVLDLMIHDIDLVLDFVKSKVKNIYALGASIVSDHVDIANARIEFENMAVANITASRVSLKNERKMMLFQQHGYIGVDFANTKVQFIKKGNEKSSANSLIPGMEILDMQFDKTDALNSELKDFVKSVKNRIKPKVSGEVGKEALNVALAVMEKIERSNSYVSYDLFEIK